MELQCHGGSVPLCMCVFICVCVLPDQCCSQLMKFSRLHEHPLLETSIFVIMSYSTFLFAEFAHLSGEGEGRCLWGSGGGEEMKKQGGLVVNYTSV